MLNNNIFSRNELFWTKEGQKKLSKKHVAVFGLGGVGGFCAETLARAGIGELTIVDFDKVSCSNINRQIVALNSTVGKKKTELFEIRLKDINPDIKLNIVDNFYTDTDSRINFGNFDFVADAIDTMRSKIQLLVNCYQNNVPIISSMGAGNRIDPTKLYIADLKNVENRNAPFISNVIYQLKKRGIIEGITFVCSRETPFSIKKITEHEEITIDNGEKIEFNKIIPASTPFVASCSGIFMAAHITENLLKN